MNRVNTSSLCIVCILAGFISTPVQAFGVSISNSKSSAEDTRNTNNRPWGNIGTAKSAPRYQPPPQISNGYYPGASPGAGWYTPMLPANSTTTNPPKVEIDIGGSVFYEQQNLIYTVRVVSDGNLKSLKPELPRIDGAVLELLDGPVASTRTNGRKNKRQIINTYRYKLMPLRSGKIVIPAIRFSGTHAKSSQQHRGPRSPSPASTPDNNFSIAADAALTLRVRSAEPEVNPWLPLHDLKLQANLLNKGPAKAGKPVTLILELQAKGALGSQLPSLVQQLESSRYRIYRDATVTKNGISANGDYLTGSRKETYTIIPLEDGWIRLPEANLSWWDVDTHSARLAELPFTHADTTAARTTAQTTDGNPMFPVYFWAPLFVALSLLAGFWLGAWHRTRPLFESVGSWLSTRRQHALQHVQHVGIKLSPVRHLKRVRMGLALLMPGSVKLWMCTRCLHAEENPDAWCTQFKSRVCQHLNISTHSPLIHITEKIIATSPQADPARLRALAHSLDGAIYGGNSLDFTAWKRELMQQLRPRLLQWRQSKTRQMKAMLPVLNPHTV